MTGRHGLALPLAAAVVSGGLVAVQQRLNGDLGRALGDPLVAAVVSFGTGLLLMTVLVLQRGARARWADLGPVPWWTRIGGLGGASLVAVGATAAPEIGVALLTVGLVAGSTVGGLAVDRAGIGPGGHQPLSPPRVAGALLCLTAIALSAHAGLQLASPLLLGLVVLAGGLISVQQALNGRVRQATGATVATFVNFVVGASALLLALLVKQVLVGVDIAHWPGKWWLYLGGPIGAAFVAMASIVVRRLGVLRLGLAVTAGQLLGAVLLDLDRGVATTTLLAAALTMTAVGVSGAGRRTPATPVPA